MLVGSWCIPQTLADVSLPNAGEISNQYISAQAIIDSPIPRLPSSYCSCVVWARNYLHRDDIRGVASLLEPTSPIPYVGGVVITRESQMGHVSAIIDIRGRTLILAEDNYSRCKVTYGRELSMDSPLIIGYK